MQSSSSSSSNRHSLPSLPFELVEEILCRTPAESLLRFKSTSKQWHALINDKKFLYNHLHHSPERFIRIDEIVHIIDPLTGTRSALPIPNEFHVPHQITSMVHCDGLLLCNCSGQSRYAELAIWNPVLRKTKWIEPSYCFTTYDYYGIGYDNRSRDNYKILRFNDPHFEYAYFRHHDIPEAEVYEFKTNSWKTIDAEMDWDVDMWCKGVSIKGNMYWIAERCNKYFILSFDFSRETFKDICVCPPPSFDARLGCFQEDRLSVLQQDQEGREIEVWITKSLGDGDVSFSKYFNVAHPNLPALLFDSDVAHAVYSIGKHTKNIMAWCQRDVEEDDKFYICITFYEIDESGIRKQIETERHEDPNYIGSFISGYVYVPSLIPLPG